MSVVVVVFKILVKPFIRLPRTTVNFMREGSEGVKTPSSPKDKGPLSDLFRDLKGLLN